MLIGFSIRVRAALVERDKFDFSVDVAVDVCIADCVRVSVFEQVLISNGLAVREQYFFERLHSDGNFLRVDIELRLFVSVPERLSSTIAQWERFPHGFNAAQRVPILQSITFRHSVSIVVADRDAIYLCYAVA